MDEFYDLLFESDIEDDDNEECEIDELDYSFETYADPNIIFTESAVLLENQYSKKINIIRERFTTLWKNRKVEQLKFKKKASSFQSDYANDASKLTKEIVKDSKYKVISTSVYQAAVYSAIYTYYVYYCMCDNIIVRVVFASNYNDVQRPSITLIHDSSNSEFDQKTILDIMKVCGDNIHTIIISKKTIALNINASVIDSCEDKLQKKYGDKFEIKNSMGVIKLTKIKDKKKKVTEDADLYDFMDEFFF